MSLTKIGLKRCRHIGVNSPAGHAHSEITAVLLMKAEAESKIIPVKRNIINYSNWISPSRLFSLLDRYCVNIYCTVTCNITGRNI